MKTCSHCKLAKELCDFNKNKGQKDGHSKQCRSCTALTNKKYIHSKKGKEIRSSYQRSEKGKLIAKNYRNNEEHKKTQSEYHKLYRKSDKNRIYKNEYHKQRIKIDVHYKLKCNLRHRLYMALKGDFKYGSAVEELGCTIEQLKLHLEAQFQSGMTWDNWGNGPDKWNIDHILPLCSFDLSKKEDRIKVCNYTNLRPLWQNDNLVKALEDRKSINK